MEIVQTDKQKLIEKFKSSSKQVQQALIDLHGKELFEEKKDKWQWVLEKNNITQEQFEEMVKGRMPHEVNLKQMEMIAFAYNDGKIASYKQRNVKKWLPVHYWDEQKQGFVFNGSNGSYATAVAGLSPRLAFFEQKHSDEAGKEFINLYAGYASK